MIKKLKKIIGYFHAAERFKGNYHATARIWFWAFVALSASAAVLLNAVVAELGGRLPLRVDLTAHAVYRLDGRTVEMLEGLDKPVNIYVLAVRRNFTGSAYMMQALSIIEQYPRHSPYLSLDFVDYAADPAFASRFPGYPLETGSIMVECDNFVKQLKLSDLYNFSLNPEGTSMIISSSRAEEALTGAILGVVNRDIVRAALLTGNGAARPGAFISLLEDNNFEITEVNPAVSDIGGGSGNIGADGGSGTVGGTAGGTSAYPGSVGGGGGGNGGSYNGGSGIVTGGTAGETAGGTPAYPGSDGGDICLAMLLGPKFDYTDNELERLDAFLYNGGAYGRTLLYTADASASPLPNLEAFLREWGVSVEDGAIYETDAQRTYQYVPFYPIADYADTLYKSMLVDSSSSFLMPMARRLRTLYEYRDSNMTETLLEFGPSAVVRPSGAPSGFTAEDAEVRGPLPALVVAGKRVVENGATVARSNIIVSASTDMLDDAYIYSTSLANSEYMLNLLNSLAGRENIIAIAPKSLAGRNLSIPSQTVSVLGITLMGVIPAIALALGLAVWLMRRHA